MSSPRVAILASGEGTTAEAFILASVEGKIQPQATLVIASKRDAGIFSRVEKLNQQYGLSIKCLYIGKKSHPAEPNEQLVPGAQSKAEEAAILQTLEAGEFDLIVLMGYMKKIGPSLVKQFGWHTDYTSPYQAMLLNTHPGLLPDTKGTFGIHAQEYVLQNHLPETGQTLHVVSDDYDEGPTIVEHRITVLREDTPATLFDRVRALEKQSLPYDLTNFIDQRRKYLDIV